MTETAQNCTDSLYLIAPKMELSNFAVICMLLLAAVFQLSAMGQEWGIAYGKRASQVVYNHLKNNPFIKKKQSNHWACFVKEVFFQPKKVSCYVRITSYRR